MYLVDRIIERCENSSRDWREGATGGRTLRITQEDYDACGKEELIEEVQRLERAGLLTVKKWVVPDSDVELVAYQVEHLPDFYRLADSESGEEYWPKQAKVNYYIRMIDQELSEGFQKEWIENYLEKLKERIAEGDLPKNIEKLEKYLEGQQDLRAGNGTKCGDSCKEILPGDYGRYGYPDGSGAAADRRKFPGTGSERTA